MNFNRLKLCLSLALLFILSQYSAAAIPRPTQPEIDAVSNALRGKDAAAQDSAVVQIKQWIDGDQLLIETWSTWMPALRDAARHQDVADLALAAMTGSVRQPANDAISTVVEFRVNALIALKKPEEAVVAAKMYYNVCEFKKTPQAIDLLGLCLARLHPDDGEIVRRFRTEQAASGGPAPGEKPQPSPTLAAIKIDAAIFDDPIQKFEGKTRIADRAIYGNLLLMADKPADAEKVYREIYQTAGTDAELAMAIDGIARCLRAPRANAWLATLQKSATTQP